MTKQDKIFELTERYGDYLKEWTRADMDHRASLNIVVEYKDEATAMAYCFGETKLLANTIAALAAKVPNLAEIILSAACEIIPNPEGGEK